MNNINRSPLDKAIHSLLATRVERGDEVGMQVAAYYRGQPIVDSWAGTLSESGPPADGSSAFQIFSVAKGVLAIAVNMLAERGQLDIDAPIMTYWPEFAAHGKGDITLRHVLSHTAGIPQMPGGMTIERLADWNGMTTAIADLVPMHAPGAQSYYHGMTYGWLLGEAVRRNDPGGRSIDQFVQAEILAPLAVDTFAFRASDLPAGRLGELSGAAIPQNLPDDAPLRIGLPASVSLEPSIFNLPIVRDALAPAVNAYANARSVARIFAMLAGGGAIDGRRLLEKSTVDALSQARPNSGAPDPFLGGPAWLSVGGFMLGNGKAATGGRPDTLFSMGAGGSLAWADRHNDLAVAITHNKMYPHQPPETDPLLQIGNLIRDHLGLD